MINIINRRAKRLYQAEFERRMNIVENTFFKEIRPLLGRQFFNAAQLMQQGVGIEGINHAVDLGRRRLIGIFKKHYKRVATVFSRRAYQIFEESKKSIYPDSYKQIDFAIELKGPKDEFWNSIGKWSTTEAAKKIRSIQRTTKGVIARVIHKGMEKGESHLDIAKRIRKTSAAINPHRSKTIALTETHGAAVKAVDTAVASTRIEMEREWVSAKDDRTRTRDKSNRFEHYRSFPNGADGEKVAQDGKFKGTGQALDYPGDSKGSAGNVIRCRCVLIYHTVKRTEQLKPHVPEEEFGEIIPGVRGKSAKKIHEHYDISKDVASAEGKSAGELKRLVQKRLGKRMYGLKSEKMDELMRFMSGRFPPNLTLNDYEAGVDNLIRQWAASSGDTSPKSIMMQLAVQKEFGLEGTTIWWEKKALKEAKKLFKIHEESARKFVREMYIGTQKHLKRKGMKTVRVARGYRGDIGIKPSTKTMPIQKTKIQLQPMSSFSGDVRTGIGFSATPSAKNPSSLIFAEVPADRVLSIPSTGFGCKDEFEYVILGSQKTKGEIVLGSMLTRDQGVLNFRHFYDQLYNEGDDYKVSIMEALSRIKGK
ncbi:MAG: hypothetical protein JRF25_00540 [Deltaproteobacteria bacterium]|nr:hypothetical protein [Deltaproteobacteria bacterium]